VSQHTRQQIKAYDGVYAVTAARPKEYITCTKVSTRDPMSGRISIATKYSDHLFFGSWSYVLVLSAATKTLNK
jgi:hypothetical protein